MPNSYHENPSVSVVIPVFNSFQLLGEIVRRLSGILFELNISCELVFVNDGSSDQSWSVICRLSQEYYWVRGINLMRNFGQGNALLCGIRAARGEIIVTMDDDLQHPPEEIPKLLAALTPEYDVVWGSPIKEKHGFLRDLASWTTKLVVRSMSGVSIAAYSGPFRAFRSCLRDGFIDYANTYVSIDVLLTFSTTRFTYVSVRHETRQSGTSNYTLLKLINHALNLVTGFSVLPLQFASVIGLLFSVIGFVLLIFILVRVVLSGIVVPGFAFLASVIAIFSGAQLLALGIIGEYLSRMYVRTMSRPAYVIKESVKNDKIS
jgi:undecaprenyl-phosphate 4-deoxy-4-formamido-L-arabinose transferase